MKFLLFSIMIAFSTTAAASDPPAAKPAAPPATQPTDPAATSGMRVYMDPKTGKLVEHPIAPVPPESTHRVDPSKIEEIQHADGSTETLFHGQADSTLTVEATADGGIRVRCSEHGEMHTHESTQEAGNDHR